MAPPAHRFPPLTRRHIAPVLAAIETLPDAREAERLIARVTPRGLCELLHGMRRWYSYQTGSAARHVLVHRDALGDVMDLAVPTGALRGFKVDLNNPLARVREGEALELPVTRNGACSSWTLAPHIPDRFSGASRTKVGVVVALAPRNGHAVPFLAPPERTAAWFDVLYRATMGAAYRFKEREYGIHATSLRVRVVRVKRRGRREDFDEGRVAAVASAAWPVSHASIPTPPTANFHRSFAAMEPASIPRPTSSSCSRIPPRRRR